MWEACCDYKCCGMDKFVGKYNIGIVVEPENINELALGIIKLLKDDKERDRLGKNGRVAAVKEFSWREAAKKVEAVIFSA